MSQEALDRWGSTLTPGKRYSVLDARGPVFGPRYERQYLANKHGCICYIEGHLNASSDPKARYAFAICSPFAEARTVEWGEDLIARVCTAYELPKGGVRGMVRGGKGSGNVARVQAPALLIEPGFLTHPPTLSMLLTGECLDALGRAIAESIRSNFPFGGVVGLSVGHAYRGNGDKGANAPGVEDPEWDQEAELAEAYLRSTAQHLLSYE